MITEEKVFRIAQGNFRIFLYYRWILQVFWAGEWKKLLLGSDGKKHRMRKASLSDSEIMTILLIFHFGSFRNFKHYYLFYVKKTIASYFPASVSYNRLIIRGLQSANAIPQSVFQPRIHTDFHEYLRRVISVNFSFIYYSIISVLNQ